MSMGFRDQKEARRRRWRLIRLLFSTALLVGLGVAAYRTGTVLAKREVTVLQAEVGRLSADLAAIRDENARLQQQTDAAMLAESQWKERYETEVPTGKARELFALVKEQIAKGADPARVEFLIAAAARERSCDTDAVTKRFLVRTPISVGASDAVTMAGGAIIVTAQGESATDAEGNPEAWFDTAKPLTARFAEPGGAATEASGLLPLHHSVVRGDREYRFSIVAAERQGFAYVTGDSCAFP